MNAAALEFRVLPATRARHLQEFNARTEIGWFGFEGSFEDPGVAVVRFRHVEAGARGGGGTGAINGGVIAAGFDAAFVLAGLGHYESDVVVTLELSVKFLSLARTQSPLAFRAHVVRSSRHFAFAEGRLAPADGGQAFAIASAMVAPAVARA